MLSRCFEATFVLVPRDPCRVPARQAVLSEGRYESISPRRALRAEPLAKHCEISLKPREACKPTRAMRRFVILSYSRRSCTLLNGDGDGVSVGAMQAAPARGCSK